jgi:L-threonylcarbamoyladenylate synthase
MPTTLPYSKKNMFFLSEKIKGGDLVAIPTETVYGLGCDATNSIAVGKIFQYKNRPSFNPLIVHYDKIDEILNNYVINDLEYEMLKVMEKESITLVVEKKINCNISLLCSNGSNLQAVRIPKKDITKEFISMCGVPIAAPSANKSNGLSPIYAKHVSASLKDKDFYILDGGKCESGIESTILFVKNNEIEILRYGAFDTDKLLNYDLNVKISNKKSGIASAGMLDKHYSPNAKIRINASNVESYEDGLLAFGTAISTTNNKKIVIKNLSEKGDLLEAAANLFKLLWEFDNEKIKNIAVMKIPNQGLGIAINDRLLRASK